MTEKSEALRLADRLENGGAIDAYACRSSTAAELRRLSAVEAQRDALLEALRAIVHAAMVHACHHALSVDGQQFYDIACAAIKAVEEGK